MVQRRTPLTVTIAALCATLPISGCGGPSPAPPAAGSPTASLAGRTNPAGPRAAGAATPSGTDIAWLQLLIAMNERIIPVLELAPTHAGDPAVEALAGEARGRRATELTAMRRIAEQSLLPTANPHEGHDMPGMVTRDQLAALDRARGPEYDRLFAEALRAHLDQAARLCDAEQRSGSDPSIQALAAQTCRAVTEERARASTLDARARR